MTEFKNMQVVGEPTPRLTHALAVVDRLMHTSFDLRAMLELGKSKDSCVLCALTVRDFLRGIGVPAAVAPVATVMWAKLDGRELHSIGIGVPNDKRKTPGRWSGHLVTIADNYLIDCVLYASIRPQWPFLRGMAALPLIEKSQRTKPLSLYPDYTALAGVSVTDTDEPGYEFSICYLDNPTNKSWADGPDAINTHYREPVVEHLVAEFRKTRETVS